MKKVLVIQQLITHYRIPVFNLLSESCDLTIWAEEMEDVDEYKFKTGKIQFAKIGSFIKIVDYKKKALENFDHVIFTFNIRIIDLIKITFIRNRNYKLSLWGIGVSSENGFDTVRKYDKVRAIMARKADSVIFYSGYPIERYVSNGVKRENIFIAHNTLDLAAKYFDSEKKYFLFVGTLKKYKRIDHLVEVYHRLVQAHPDIQPLHIIGDGEYYDSLVSMVEKYSLTEKVVIHGSITDTAKLEEFYRHAIASVSPSQAGLSVLQSLAMGVPFITKADAITGGERLNIVDGFNGYLAKDDDELIVRMTTLSKDLDQAKKLGKNAYAYFTDKCSLENMVSGFLNAIN